MDSKKLAITALVVLALLVALALVVAPNLSELITRIHPIPQH